jgi:hypothetical protein
VKSEEMYVDRQLLVKHILADMNKEATVEKLPLLCNGALITPSQQGKGYVFCVVFAEGL